MVLASMLPAPLWAQAVGAADGFATGVTGGGKTNIVRPTSLAQLESALCGSFYAGRCVDTQPRVIEIDKAFDFTGSVEINGSSKTTEQGCIASTCGVSQSSQSQLARNEYKICQGRKAIPVTYDNAGLQKIQIGSNKTLVGKGKNAAIIGRGLRIGDGNKNVIIQNIRISDINSRVIWGGDALTIDNADMIWVDHNLFARIGRQMVATGAGSATHVTLSNNEFDGRTSYSITCDAHHYYLWIFVGAHDTITLARNYIHNTSGRGPHAGGINNAVVAVHMVNNYFENLSSEGAASPRTTTATLLLEGNYFDHVTMPLYRYITNPPGPGYAFSPFIGQANQRNDLCLKYIGRNCVANDVLSSGTSYEPLDVQAISAFQALRGLLINPMSAAQVRQTVRSKAGVGVIN
jgi:pectin lyase